MDAFRKVVTPDDLIKQLHSSLAPLHNRNQTFKNDVGGRSGSIFFFSHDRRFLVKTMTDSELSQMLRMLPAWSNHLSSKQKTLIAKIYGCFTVRTRYINEHRCFHVLLMECCARLKVPARLKYNFDLKGCLYHRLVSEPTLPSTTLKDQNLIQLCENQKVRFLIEKEELSDLIFVLRNDVEFLKSNQLMDYSLLLMVEERGWEQCVAEDHHQIVTDDYVFHVAIIDYL